MHQKFKKKSNEYSQKTVDLSQGFWWSLAESVGKLDTECQEIKYIIFTLFVHEHMHKTHTNSKKKNIDIQWITVPRNRRAQTQRTDSIDALHENKFRAIGFDRWMVQRV